LKNLGRMIPVIEEKEEISPCLTVKTCGLPSLEHQRKQITAKAKELMEQIKEAQNAENWKLFEKLNDKLDILRRKQKNILYKLGLREYNDDEFVEYAPGQFIKASEYFWLMND